jgi:hypothetical protein
LLLRPSLDAFALASDRLPGLKMAPHSDRTD